MIPGIWLVWNNQKNDIKSQAWNRTIPLIKSLFLCIYHVLDNVSCSLWLLCFEVKLPYSLFPCPCTRYFIEAILTAVLVRGGLVLSHAAIFIKLVYWVYAHKPFCLPGWAAGWVCGWVWAGSGCAPWPLLGHACQNTPIRSSTITTLLICYNFYKH